MPHRIIHWSNQAHDIVCFLVGSVSLTLSAMEGIESVLRVGVLVFTLVFMAFGVEMRRRRLNGYRPPKKCAADEDDDD